ncbi:DUF305 domain-containing protein [Atribacter laminatus]|uniref:DUF305 domain-containing protein n=1 Tax=Atribacter laminatus TaxID=2847778 RepID=A0A7T1AKM0_ATRLM|nr:DUF305 domain-containing protein [Atribacter laminatus]QPM67654.1 hypothetical protein RT761_00865 [Atribacter laminatus]
MMKIKNKFISLLLSIFLVFLLIGGAFAQTNHGDEEMEHGTGMMVNIPGEELNVKFLSMMIAHHEGAVEMSQYVIPLAKDPQVLSWAESIINNQKEEIALMKSWITEWVANDTSAQTTMAHEMETMLKLLQEATNPERAFVELMVDHHLSAIEMAIPILMQGEDPKLLNLARDIIATQTEEIYQFRLWLIKLNNY